MPIDGAGRRPASPTSTVGGDRFVGRAGGAVVDDHDAAAGERAGEGHRARQRGAHRLARRAPSRSTPRWPAPQGDVGRVEAARPPRARAAAATRPTGSASARGRGPRRSGERAAGRAAGRAGDGSGASIRSSVPASRTAAARRRRPVETACAVDALWTPAGSRRPVRRLAAGAGVDYPGRAAPPGLTSHAADRDGACSCGPDHPWATILGPDQPGRVGSRAGVRASRHPPAAAN